MTPMISQMVSTISGSKPEKKALAEIEPKGKKELDLVQERITFRNHSAHNTIKMSEFKDKFPELKNYTLTQYDQDENLVCDLGFHISPPPNVKMCTLSEGAWGANYIEGLSERIPHISAKAFPSDDGSYRIRELNFHAYNYILYVPFTSPKWETGWNPIQEALIGRGKLSPTQWRYWVYAHEMDHMQGYFSYWKFMLIKIVAALNTHFEMQEFAEKSILELQYNNVLNFPIGFSRANAFDEFTRGIPQCGSRFNITKWKPDEIFTWRQWEDFSDTLKLQCFNDVNIPRFGKHPFNLVSEAKNRQKIESELDTAIRKNETNKFINTLQRYTEAYNSK